MIGSSLIALFLMRSELKSFVGPVLDYTVEVGSLVSRKQLDTVEEHVRDATGKGATMLAGGRSRPDLGPPFYEPTILTYVRAG